MSWAPPQAAWLRLCQWLQPWPDPSTTLGAGGRSYAAPGAVRRRQNGKIPWMVLSHLVTEIQLSLPHVPLEILVWSYLSSSLGSETKTPLRNASQGQGPGILSPLCRKRTDAGEVPRRGLLAVPCHSSFDIRSTGLSPQLTLRATASSVVGHPALLCMKARELHSIIIFWALGPVLGLATKQKESLISRSLHLSGNAVICTSAQKQICITPYNASVWESHLPSEWACLITRHCHPVQLCCSSHM